MLPQNRSCPKLPVAYQFSHHAIRKVCHPCVEALWHTSHQSASKQGQLTFPCSAMRELWYAMGNFGQEWFQGSFAFTRSDSESIFQQQFGENHRDDSCYYLTWPRGRVKSRIHDRLGAKSANWLASWLCSQPRFQFRYAKQG